MLDFISYPLGQFLNFIYNTLALHSYGLAIIIFTLFIRMILLPLTFKQYHSMTKMQTIQPEIQEIQKRYKNDKERLNQELLKVYQENKVNPAGGCLPLVVQMPILFSLLYVIAKPLTYMLKMDPKKIADLVASTSKTTDKITGYYEQIGAVNHHHILNMKFLGLNLGLVPVWNPSILFSNTQWTQYLPLLIIPILATTTTFFASKLAMSKQLPAQTDNATASSMQNSMLYVGPLMTLIFSFQFPAGLGLYWIAGNTVQVCQQLYINKYIKKKKEEVKN